MLMRRGEPKTLFMKLAKPLFLRNMALLGSRESSEYRFVRAVLLLPLLAPTPPSSRE